MKTVPLTRGFVTLVDDSDFDRVNQFKWYAQGKASVRIYAARRDKKTRKMVYMHRFVLGAPDELDVDHREGGGLDNRRHNLRLATPSQNGANQKKGTRRSSQFKGVSWDKRLKKWVAYCSDGLRKIHLGCFLDEQEVAHAYDAAASKFFGEFAALNFPVKRRG